MIMKKKDFDYREESDTLAQFGTSSVFQICQPIVGVEFFSNPFPSTTVTLSIETLRKKFNR